MRRATILLTTLGCVLTAAGTASGQGDSTAVPYLLSDQSTEEIGCFDACACPVLIRGPVRGSFTLIPTGLDGLFRTFDVLDVDWKAPDAQSEVQITGSGTYRVGGEFASQHQLSLDLSIGGREPRRFDSGLVAGGGDFPDITVDIAANAFFCYDTVFRVRAKPMRTADVGPRSARPRISAIVPNPFRGGMQVHFDLREAGPVRLAVYGVGGREVRSLVRAWRDAGPQMVGWDGRASDGTEASPGLYFLRLDAPGARDVRVAVKLR